MTKIKLGVNIDHVATLRQARREFEPDPITAAVICEKAGAYSIVCHLREDRRHILDADVKKLRKMVKTRLNLEMAMSQDIINQALEIGPDQATLVPEKRQEITTEGGLDIIRYFRRTKQTVHTLQQGGISVSLFLDPDRKQIARAKETGAEMIELHTGRYALCKTKSSTLKQLSKLKEMTHYAQSLGFIVNAGHGLNYENTKAVAQIPGIEELNIGHSIISRAVFVGLKQAVKDMLKLLK